VAWYALYSVYRAESDSLLTIRAGLNRLKPKLV
jgi:hypothetical protein